MATSRLNILINAKNNATSTIQQVDRQLGGLERTVGLLGKVATAGIIGAAVAQAGKYAIALDQQATAALRAKSAAVELAGSQRQLNELMSVYQRVTRGVVPEVEAMKDITRLAAIGFADSSEELERFLTAATGAAAATGSSIDYIVGQLQLTIANQSTMRLDQLGLGVSEVTARIEELKDAQAGLSTEAAYQEAVIGLLNEKFGGLATGSATAATGMETLGRAWADFTSTVATLSQGPIDAAAQGLANAIDSVNDKLNEGITANAERTIFAVGDSITRLADEYEVQAERMRQAGIGGDPAALQEAANRMEMLRAAMVQVGNSYNRAAEITGVPLLDLGLLQNGVVAFVDMEQAIDEAGNAAEETGSKLLNMGIEAVAAAQSFDSAMSRTRSNMQSLQGIASGLVDNFGALGTQDWLAEQNTMLRLYQQQWRDIDGHSQDYIDNVLTPAYLSTLREQSSELDKARDSTVKLAATVPQVSKEFQNLQSAVQSALSGALDPGVGVDPDKLLENLFGFRENAINENARRLADIAANGLKDQDWLGAFAREAPDIWQAIRMASNPQEEAAFLLRDFQDGLRPDLIDKGRAKEIVRRMIRGDANMADLAREISEELAAEMGIPLQEALAKSQAALGVGGNGAGSEIGNALGQGAVDAMSTGGKGAEAVDAFVASMRAVYSRLNSAGQDAGKQWGSGFMETVGESVPPQLINMLVNLVTPGVMAEFYQRGTLVGAEQ